MSGVRENKLDPLIVYAAQTNIKWKAKDENLEKIRQILSSIKPEPGAIIVLPEMFNTGFCMDVEEICEEPGGDTEKVISFLSSSFRVLIIAGIPLKAENGKGKNAAVVFAPDGSVAFRFSKLHPFSPAEEESYYIRGDEIVIVEYGGWKISPFICYDLRFPESYRAAALEGSEVLVTIANWPEKRAPHWLPLLQSRAIENLAYSIGVNRVGSSPENNYVGQSVIFSPWGEIISVADNAECVLRAELSRQKILDIRKNFPCLEDAKPSFAPEIKKVKISQFS